MQSFAIVLDLTEDYFDNLLVRPGASMRMIRYPPSSFNREHPGIGAHRDYECESVVNNAIYRHSRNYQYIHTNTLDRKASRFYVRIVPMVSKYEHAVVIGSTLSPSREHW